ncbi:MAG: aminotransferase class IV, partial [Candidatus Omnitrophica bacterium]|nr:aminotransferase class IV [Candidatus Omnitrophota bacterium]
MGTLRGITRDTVLEIAKSKGIGTYESVLTRYDIYTSDECFLTGTAAEIIPVVRVDGRKIGNGKVGKITKLIMGEFRNLTKTEGIRYSL